MTLRVLSPQAKAAIEAEFPKYPDRRSVLLPALWIAQREVGYLPETAMLDVAQILDLSPVQVSEVVTFYSMYHLKPVGKYHIQFCKTLSCALVGAGAILEHIQTRLGIAVGERTPDGLFSIGLVECLAGCGSGPMMQINSDYYEYLTTEKVDRIFDDLKVFGQSALASRPYRIPLEMVS